MKDVSCYELYSVAYKYKAQGAQGYTQSVIIRCVKGIEIDIHKRLY